LLVLPEWTRHGAVSALDGIVSSCGLERLPDR